MSYSLAYGTEAVIPLEVGPPTNWTALVESGGNDNALARELDFAEEKWEQAWRLEKLMRSFNTKVSPKEFGVDDLVLRKVLGNTKGQDR